MSSEGGVGTLGRYGDVTSGKTTLQTGLWRRIVVVVRCKGKYVEEKEEDDEAGDGVVPVMEEELEMVVGSFVKVRDEIDKPQGGWGSVSQCAVCS